MEKYAELIVKDFRAISDADITLNGITVVAGNNGCGKSSLSKLLYYIYHYANDYESIATNIVKKHISEYCDALGTLWHIASEQNQEDVFLEYLEKNFSKYKGTRYNITVTKKRYVTDSEKNDLKNLTDVEHIDITNCSYILFERITQKINYFDSDINNRRYDWFAEKVEDKFAVNELKNVHMEEFGETIFGEGTKNLPEIQYVKKIAYVESPINFGRDKMPIDYVNELNELAKQPPLREYAGSSINDIISRGVMNGDSTFDKEFFSGGFKYKRNDGKIFDLLECATGIKSFAILQMLLKNGFIGKETMLILDEPESHLHPQWIVEYANLIVLLQKQLGTKFFIATHSTDMVSAIRYIAEKEDCLKNVSFYLADELQDGKYSYKDLQNDIEPIFESFNKSYAKLDEYAR